MPVTAKKTASKRTTSKKSPARQTKAGQNAQKQMWAVVLFALGLLLGAMIFIKGDKLWLSLHNVFFGVFGWSAYFLPPLVIYIAVIAALDKPLSSIKAKLWQVAALIIMISGAIQIFGSGLPNEATFVENIASLYEGGKSLSGGGVAGIVLAGPLVAMFAKTGASIIIVLAIVVFAMLITGTTLISLYRWAVSPMLSLKEDYAERISAESLKEKDDKRRAENPQGQKQKNGNPPEEKPKASGRRRFEYDVDISGDSEPLQAEDVRNAASGVEALSGDELPVGEEIIPGHPVITDFHGEKGWEEDPDESLDRLVAAAGQALARKKNASLSVKDRPVEYISPEEFSQRREAADIVPEPETVQEEGHHPLDDDILEALRAEEAEDAFGEFPDGRYDDGESLTFRNTGEIGAEALSGGLAAFGLAQNPGHRGLPAENSPEPAEYRYPPESLLRPSKAASNEDVTEELRSNAQTLVDTLKSFGVQTRITDICRGPAVTRYELQPSAGVKISKITGLADDIALNLAAAGIRIEAPIPNKAAVGIEVPNKVVSMVSIRDLLGTGDFRRAESSVTVALGKDIAGNSMFADIGKMPHLLIAGATGSGKSVCINSVIISLLYKSSPDDVKLLMIDPKVVELGVYNGIPHLLIPVVTDPKKAAGALNWAVTEMENRYRTFAEHGVRDLAGFNRVAQTRPELSGMPKIVIIIDELADLMMTAPSEVEDAICRLAQKARAAGMHLVIATQRPSVDVITGVIKANIPSRIAFSVSSQIDSRTILDMGGAEKLLGRGDMLFYPVGAAKPVRVQGCFVTDDEVESVVSYIKQGEQADYDQEIVEEIGRFAIKEKGSRDKDADSDFEGEDEMLPLAIECVVDAGQASTSQLQRRLKLGYARAARIIDQLEERGIVGPFEGSKPRQVLISRERWTEMKLNRDYGGRQTSLYGE